MANLESKIEEIAVSALQKAAQYEGFGRVPDQVLAFRDDPVWSHFGMDTETFPKLRYIGNYYTSIMTMMGHMYEKFVRAIFLETFGLKVRQLSLSIDLVIEGKRKRRRLDFQLDSAVMSNVADEERFASVLADIDPGNKGGRMGFECRCCYQIGDDKRIQADETAAIYLREHGYLPVLMIFCTTSLEQPVMRLRKTGHVTEGQASYDLLQRISGFDLYGALVRLRPKLAQEMQRVMQVFQVPTL